MAPSHTPAAARRSTGALPLKVTGRVEVSRLARELAELDDQLLQLELRQRGAAVSLPKTSRLLDETAQINQLNLLQTNDRQRLLKFLQAVHARAPVINISFSADPSPVFTEKLIVWLRREIHPLLLLTVGLQPNLGAGCVVRTYNKYFDMSLREDFASKRELLKAALSAPVSLAAAPAPAAAAAEVPHE